MDCFVATSIAPNAGAMLGGGHPSCSISRPRAREAARVETFSVSAKNMAIPTRLAISLSAKPGDDDFLVFFAVGAGLTDSSRANERPKGTRSFLCQYNVHPPQDCGLAFSSRGAPIDIFTEEKIDIQVQSN